MTTKYDVEITTPKGIEVFFGLDYYPSKDGEFLSLKKKGGNVTLIRTDNILRIDLKQYEETLKEGEEYVK